MANAKCGRRAGFSLNPGTPTPEVGDATLLVRCRLQHAAKPDGIVDKSIHALRIDGKQAFGLVAHLEQANFDFQPVKCSAHVAVRRGLGSERDNLVLEIGRSRMPDEVLTDIRPSASATA
jgi:hypothetical protein